MLHVVGLDGEVQHVVVFMQGIDEVQPTPFHIGMQTHDEVLRIGLQRLEVEFTGRKNTVVGGHQGKCHIAFVTAEQAQVVNGVAVCFVFLQFCTLHISAFGGECQAEAAVL